MMKKRLIAYWLLFLSLLMLTTSCTAPPVTPIRIGVNSWPPCEVWYIAEAQGYFDNTPVELVRFTAWSDNMAALYAGNIDITHSTYFNSVYYANKGESSRLWLPIDYSEGSDGLVIKNSIPNVQDLVGKAIGVEIGTDEHYLLYKALRLNQVDIHEVTLKSIPSYDSHNAFIANETDALFTYEPFLSQAAAEGNGRMVFSTKDLPGHMVDALVLREQSFTNNPRAFETIKNAWYKSLAYIQANPEEAFRIMSQKEGMSAEDFKAFYNSFTFFGEQEAKALIQSDDLYNRLKEMSDFCISEKLITTPTNIDQLLLKD